MRISTKIRSQLSKMIHPVALLAASLGLSGCGDSTTEAPPKPAAATPAPTASGVKDPDDVPITEKDVKRPKNYAEAITRIEGFRDVIRDEIAAGRPTKAHRALDELDIVLNWLPGIARDSGVSKDNWEAVNTTAQKIRDLFNQVHSRIDAKQEPDYRSVSEGINQAIASLKTFYTASAPVEPAVKP